MSTGYGHHHYEDLIEKNSIVLEGYEQLDALMDWIGDSQFVLLGEASHGTHEYYTWRSAISKRLIEEKGFRFIAVEGDWPDCYRLNRYIRNYEDSGKDAASVLRAFNRWPTWMWANWEIVALTEWLRKYNDRQAAPGKKVGFYGLDVYSLWESLDSIAKYLDENDMNGRKAVQAAIECFEPFGDREGQAYGRASLMVPSICEDEVVRLLMEIRKNIGTIYPKDAEKTLNLEWNARVIIDAEKYYRAMVRSGVDSWNIRDQHMADTLDNLIDYYGKDTKAIVWEHNTHIGDARATNMARTGMLNVGQLLNQDYGADKVFPVGFGSYGGTVIAGTEWGEAAQEMKVPDAQSESWEDILHSMGAKNRLLLMDEQLKQAMGQRVIGHRAIGVVYDPSYERYGNYVPSKMAQRYDAFIYLDKTRALHPLHVPQDQSQMPETYPFGL